MNTRHPRAQRRRPHRGAHAAEPRDLRRAAGNGSAGPRSWTAATADKYVLYERSVQDPEAEIAFIDRVFRSIFGRKPSSLREDFCGTALLCARWIESHPDRTATGVDLDPRVLAWGRRHHLAELDEPGRRIQLLAQDVRASRSRQFDVINAFNFSYWVFKTRIAMLDYFRAARQSLGEEGLFYLDAYGGWESMEPMLERRKVRGGFTYVWDQNRIDPITHHVINHIHFEFRDGTKLEKAFTYDWRFWTLPELQELLDEAGFSEVRVYWDDTEDDEEPDYRVRRRASNQPGWLAYLVAVR